MLAPAPVVDVRRNPEEEPRTLACHGQGLVQFEPRTAPSSHASKYRHDLEAVAGKVCVGNLGHRHGVVVTNVDAIPIARNGIELSFFYDCLTDFGAFLESHDHAHVEPSFPDSARRARRSILLNKPPKH